MGGNLITQASDGSWKKVVVTHRITYAEYSRLISFVKKSDILAKFYFDQKNQNYIMILYNYIMILYLP